MPNLPWSLFCAINFLCVYKGLIDCFKLPLFVFPFYSSDLKKEKTFENVYNPLEEVSVPLTTAWALVKNLHYASQEYRKPFSRVII